MLVKNKLTNCIYTLTMTNANIYWTVFYATIYERTQSS